MFRCTESGSFCAGLSVMRKSGLYEIPKQRLGTNRCTGEFGMELASAEPRMIPELHDLDEFMVAPTVYPADDEPGLLFEPVPICVVEFVPVPVPFRDSVCGIGSAGFRAGCQFASVSAEAHGSPEIDYTPLFRQ